ncbi:MAG TPA: HAMP domain-containing sensor histidine kinase [Actinocrinis sp.]|nr:HAMP domain-containing sensor histidine kinase [Actinocrinis sp.]
MSRSSRARMTWPPGQHPLQRWHGSPLSHRLAALLLAVFALVATVSGTASAIVLRDSLHQDLDNQLIDLAEGTRTAALDHKISVTGDNKWLLSTDDLYVGFFDQSVPTAPGQPKLPDPLPADGFSTTVLATGGQGSGYRMRALPMGDGRSVVVAAPTSQTMLASQEVSYVAGMSGLLSLVALAFIGTFVVRRELRPLERVATLADTAAGGDFTSRMDLTALPPGTEVGRLGTALNGMLDELQGALAARDASQSRLRQFAADASHELRTPLQSIRGYAELRLSGAMPDGRDVDEAMERITAEVKRMTRLTEELLLLARFDEQQEAEFEPVDLGRLVADACRDAAAVEPGRPIEVRVCGELPVLGDEMQLSRLVVNLLGNVRMHTPPSTPVEVTARLETGRVGPRAVLIVRDHGAGIPAEALPHVFDRFYRVDRSRSRASGGSGLGLAIVAAVVDAHHGSITVEAPAAGGTLVTVRLPALRESEPEAACAGAGLETAAAAASLAPDVRGPAAQ